MPQQINLCSLTLQKPRQPFSAHTMLVVLGGVVLVGGALCFAWVWNLEKAGQGFATAVQNQTLEMQSLQAAIDRSKTLAQPPSPELIKEAQDKRAEIDRQEQILRALQQGNWPSGQGHSDRLALVARSIPAPVWVTEVKADSVRMEVSGFTLEPSALNEWVARLSASPLMQGLRLATVKIQSTALQAESPAVAGTAPTLNGREAWSFNLVSEQMLIANPASLGGTP